MKKILIVVGTRPNFIKVTRFVRVAKENYKNIEIKIAHTGQHSDENMAGVFFQQFNLQPDFFLEIKSKSPVGQIGEIMLALENIILKTYTPDLIITPGDVNSTLAVAITANKLNIKLAHLESGLRSFDRSMPEEINRIIADELADYYFVTERSGVENLKAEGKKGQIYFVGNTMIDTLVDQEENIGNSDIESRLNINEPYILSTFHRPATVDNYNGLKKLVELFESLTRKFKIVFPVHPRTRNRLIEFGLDERIVRMRNLLMIEPLGYVEFQKLVKDCTLVITDSGGIQEETTYRQVPCLTVRDSTERPITVEVGSNQLTPFDNKTIIEHIDSIIAGRFKKGEIPELWDGRSTERILKICSEILSLNH